MPRRIRSQEFNGNIYTTSNLGIIKIQNIATDFAIAGNPKGLDLDIQTATTGAWFPNNTSVAYRLVWGIRDLNNNYIYGPPSGRFIISNNTGGARSTQFQFFIPFGITQQHFFQLYRSKYVASGVDPGDELSLCYERNPTAAEVANQQVLFASVDDLTDEALLGAALYTNETQQGIVNQNTRPPYARDICAYKQYMLYAYTKINQSLNINMVGVDASINGQTITIAGTLYTASTAAENITTGTFLATTAGTPASNITATAQSLVKVINQYTANTRVYAYYVSDFSEVPGKIYIESRNLGDSPWFVVGSAAMSKYWSPLLPQTQVIGFTSSDDDGPNRIISSKFQQAEHVPYKNVFEVGSKNESILRIVALRDSVIIFKERSVWRLVGDFLENFSISLLDNTVSTVAIDSVAVLNNLAFALTNQGVVAVSDNGVQLVSGKAVQDEILASVKFTTADNIINDVTTAIGHERDNCYILGIPAYTDLPGSSPPRISASFRVAYVYNYITNSWTKWFLESNCFTVHEDRVCYGLYNVKQNGDLQQGTIFKQRDGYADVAINNFDYPPQFEFCDPSGTLTINSIDPTLNQVTGVFVDGVKYSDNSPYYLPPDYGWVLRDGTRKRLLKRNLGGGVYEFDSVVGLVAGLTYTIFRNIKMSLTYCPRIQGDPLEIKQYDEASFDLGTMNADSFTVGFANSSNPMLDPVSDYFYGSGTIITNPIRIELNDFTSTLGYGAPSYFPHNPQRIFVPSDQQVGTLLYVQISNQVAACRFEVNGVGVGVRLSGSHRVR